LGVLLAAAVAGGPVARAQAPPAPGKRALLIGISKYAHGGDANNEWWDLDSAPDVSALSTLLADKFGFAAADIQTLTTRSETTRASILAAFEQLIAGTHKGDVVFIHYSGHGTPVPDLDGDEFDGVDESIVPSDYVSRKDGSRNITDDTLGALIKKLTAREPASVTLTFDSCFSGSQTRGGRMVARGGNFLDPMPAPRPGRDPDVTGLGGRDRVASGYVVISASRNDQLSYETDDGSGGSMGLLSFALVKALRDATPNTTYRDLFDDVFETMIGRNPVQTPQLEGDLDTKVLNGAASPVQPYIQTQVDGKGRVVLEAGSLHGVTPGSQFALYPRGTKTFNGQSSIGTATVAAVTATTAILTPPAGALIDALRFGRAVETAHKYGDAALRVDVSAAASLPRAAEVSAAIQRMADERELIRTTRGGAWDVKLNPARGGVELIRPDGTIAETLRDSPSLAGDVTDAIEHEARWQAIAALDHRDPEIGVEVRLVPADATLDAQGVVTSAVPKAPPRAPGGQIVMQMGEYFMVEVRNTGKLDAFITVLDLSPNGCIYPIWPHPKISRTVQENKLRAAADPRTSPWTLIRYPYVFGVGGPAGNELLKVIATDVPADFSSLFSTPCASDMSRDIKSQTTPIGRLLARVARGNSRGFDAAAEPPDPTKWSAGGFSFIISPGPSKPARN
jgi:hypothetical protein